MNNTPSEKFISLPDSVNTANQIEIDRQGEYYHDRQYFYGYDDNVPDDDEEFDDYLKTQILVKLYEKIGKDNCFGRELIREGYIGYRQDIYVECGKQMKQLLLKDIPNERKIKDIPNEREIYKQITIRSITLCKELQKKGLFTGLVEHFLSLDGIEAVQIESVQPEWLKERLTKSNNWYKQGTSENYVRFKEEGKGDTKFTLF